MTVRSSKGPVLGARIAGDVLELVQNVLKYIAHAVLGERNTVLAPDVEREACIHGKNRFNTTIFTELQIFHES